MPALTWSPMVAPWNTLQRTNRPTITKRARYTAVAQIAMNSARAWLSQAGEPAASDMSTRPASSARVVAKYW